MQCYIHGISVISARWSPDRGVTYMQCYQQDTKSVFSASYEGKFPEDMIDVAVQRDYLAVVSFFKDSARVSLVSWGEA